MHSLLTATAALDVALDALADPEQARGPGAKHWVSGPLFRVLEVNNEKVARTTPKRKPKRTAEKGDHARHVVAGE